MKQRATHFAPMLLAGLSLTLMGQGCWSFVRTGVNLNPTPEERAQAIEAEQSGTSTAKKMPPKEEPRTPAVEASSTSISFTHKIGTTRCPQTIGSVTLRGVNLPDSARWRAESGSKLIWLDVTKDGSFYDPLKLTFTCTLASYVSQTVEGKIIVTAFDPADPSKPLATTTITVTGTIQK
jgi:hypothetical protein